MTSQMSRSGFLVITAVPEYPGPQNPKYKGVNCVPVYPSPIPSEGEAIDEYVFGDFKNDETNLIPTIDQAIRLHQRLSGEREFEIIFCSNEAAGFQIPGTLNFATDFLGFDVCGMADFYSYVDDLYPDNWADPFRSQLNEYGLFDNVDDARSFVECCVAHRATNPADIEILAVFHVQLKSSATRS